MILSPEHFMRTEMNRRLEQAPVRPRRSFTIRSRSPRSLAIPARVRGAAA